MKKWLVLYAFILCLLVPAWVDARGDKGNAKFLGAFPAGKPVYLTLDDRGNLYASQVDGSVRVYTADGEFVRSFGGDNKKWKSILREARGMSFYKGKLFVVDGFNSWIAIFDRDGKFIEKFGSWGSAPKEFMEPRGVYLRDGLMYVADTGNARIQILGENGVYLGSVGNTGGGDASLVMPIQVVADEWGTTYVSDSVYKRIMVYDGEGLYQGYLAWVRLPSYIALSDNGIYVVEKAQTKVYKYSYKFDPLFSFGGWGKGKGRFRSVEGIATNGKGRVYVADPQQGKIHMFDTIETEAVPTEAKGLPPTSVLWVRDLELQAGKVIWDRADTIYVIDEKHNSIAVIKDGKLIRTIEVPGAGIIALTLSRKDGSLWVLDGWRRKVIKLDSDYKVVQSFGEEGMKPGQFMGLADIAVDSEGRIMVADKGNHMVHMFSENGTFIDIVGKGGLSELLKKPIALLLDEDDNIFVLDQKRRLVSIYSPRGSLLVEFGRTKEFSGWFKKPVDMTLMGNEIMVLDLDDHRIKSFSIKGHFIRAFSTRGHGRGDLMDPVSLEVIGDDRLVISDQGNNRLQFLRFMNWVKFDLEDDPRRKVNPSDTKFSE